MSDNNASGSRAVARRNFWHKAGWQDATETALAADASSRRYFRLTRADGSAAIVMDAPPDKEDIGPFVEIADILTGFGYSVPQVQAEDRTAGFLLLEDMGDLTFTRALEAGHSESELYRLAGDVLGDLVQRDVSGLRDRVPAYSDEKLLDEAMRFVDWYLRRGLGLSIGDDAREDYAEAWRSVFPLVRSGPEVLVLRDFHVDNMMVLADRQHLAACGLLDFQDAVIGPASYDLVSLLQDCRRDVSDEVAGDVRARFFDAATAITDRDGFLRSYHVLGVQRHLKNIGGFARQSVFLGNHSYLRFIDRMWRFTLQNLSDEALAPVRDWIEKHVPENHRVTPPPGGRAA